MNSKIKKHASSIIAGLIAELLVILVSAACIFGLLKLWPDVFFEYGFWKLFASFWIFKILFNILRGRGRGKNK